MRFWCSRGKHWVNEESFARDTGRPGRKRNGRARWCRACWRSWHAEKRADDPDYFARRSRAWRRANPERNRELNSASARRQHERAKRAVVDAYGGRCTCCGEDEIHFLTVEHVTPESAERHRYPNGRRISGTKMLRMIAAEGFPDDITVLCFNCNCARGQYGACPHERDFVARYEGVV